ncbi:hypothetical protein [Alkaliphilus sp. B6464]|uniref:hypothetical protein n=1 Tax=Alkaliphilus sp. B6464 TaxID=2731219 RepID=UPI001BA7A36C|nr:hypothetical protein [Alkaliphilus sp. B6464]QUH21824.1 hypothetical protein HYG84_17970 [Alkaliphilus sp. B6464]
MDDIDIYKVLFLFWLILQLLSWHQCNMGDFIDGTRKEVLISNLGSIPLMMMRSLIMALIFFIPISIMKWCIIKFFI